MLKKLVFRYEWLILIGLTIAILAGLDALKVITVGDSVFWLIAGLALATEAIIEWYFDKKSDLGGLE